MKQFIAAVVAGFLSVAVAGAYAGESKGDDKKSDTGMTKSEKGQSKADDKKGSKDKKGEATK
jgi:hypothetical protein